MSGTKDAKITEKNVVFDSIKSLAQGSPFESIDNLPKGPYFIAIEGCIGSGKSVFLRKLCDVLRAQGISLQDCQEDVENWTNFGPDGDDVLGMFYDDPKGYSSIFQFLVMSSKTGRVFPFVGKTDAVGAPISIIQERCPTTDMEFARGGYERGHISPTEYQILKNMCGSITELLFNNYTVVVINIVTTAEDCMRRVETRGRLQEKSITEDYLREVIAGSERSVATMKSFGAHVVNISNPFKGIPGEDTNAVRSEFLDKAVQIALKVSK